MLGKKINLLPIIMLKKHVVKYIKNNFVFLLFELFSYIICRSI